MKYSDENYNIIRIEIEFDTDACELSANQIEQFEKALSPLREPLKDFPAAALYITVQYMPPSHDNRVKVVRNDENCLSDPRM